MPRTSLGSTLCRYARFAPFGESVISRDEALRVGAAEIAKRGIGTGARAAYLHSEIDWRAPLLYGGPNLDDCWIVYAERPITGLESSTIVLVSRETGAVLYAGSAYDEG
jgi:hypothetical protein